MTSSLATRTLLVKLRSIPENYERFMLHLKIGDIQDPFARSIYEAFAERYDLEKGELRYPFYETLTEDQKVKWSEYPTDDTLSSDEDIEQICKDLKREQQTAQTAKHLKVALDTLTVENYDRVMDKCYDDIPSDSLEKMWTDLEEPAEELIQTIKDRLGGKGKNPTPFKVLNFYLDGGTEPGELIIIAGVPNSGKSMLAGHYAFSLAMAKLGRVAVCGLEMKSSQYHQRMVALAASKGLCGMENMTQSHMNRPKGGRINPNYEAFIREVNDDLQIRYLKCMMINLPELEKQFLAAVKVHKCKFIILDHLLLVDGKEEERIMVHKITQFMKTFAAQHDVTCIGVSQMSRDTDDYDPQMKNMAGGRGIEQNASTILAITKVKDEDDGPNFSGGGKAPDNGIRKISLIKSREAAKDKFLLTRFNGNEALFDQIIPDDWDSLKGLNPSDVDFTWTY